MSRLRLTMACWDYDRVAALKSGEVAIDGVDLNFLAQPVEETFFRMLRHHEFDIAEMSLSSYVVSLARGDSPFIAVPVFPSRFFRHSCIFVSAASGIETPADLAGRRIGVPEYQMTAPSGSGASSPTSMVWRRMPWSTGRGRGATGARGKAAHRLPERFRLRAIGAEQTLASMLADGEIDALFTARTPSTFHTRPHHVRRLFPDYRAVEQDYYRRAGIFPIMHTVVIRREVYRQPLACAVTVQGASTGAAEGVRGPAPDRSAQDHAARLPAHVEQAEA